MSENKFPRASEKLSLLAEEAEMAKEDNAPQTRFRVRSIREEDETKDTLNSPAKEKSGRGPRVDLTSVLTKTLAKKKGTPVKESSDQEPKRPTGIKIKDFPSRRSTLTVDPPIKHPIGAKVKISPTSDDVGVDCISRYAYLIEKILSDLNVNSEDVINEDRAYCEMIDLYKAVIVSRDTYTDSSLHKDLLNSGLPTLFIGYAMFRLNLFYGGTNSVKSGNGFIKRKVELDLDCELFSQLELKEEVYLPTDVVICKLGDNLVPIVKDGEEILGFKDTKRNFYAIAFHPEHYKFMKGHIMFKNFFDMHSVKRNLVLSSKITQTTSFLTERVKSKYAIVLVTSGLKSLAMAAFVKMLLPLERITFLHFITTLSPKNDNEVLENRFKEIGITDLTIVNKFVFFDSFQCPLSHQNTDGSIETNNHSILEELDSTWKKRLFAKAMACVVDEYVTENIANVTDVLIFFGFTKLDMMKSVPYGAAFDNIILRDTLYSSDYRDNLVFPLSSFYREDLTLVLEELGQKGEFNFHPFPATGFLSRVLCAPITEFTQVHSVRRLVNDILRFGKADTENQSTDHIIKCTTAEEQQKLAMFASNCVKALTVPKMHFGEYTERVRYCDKIIAVVLFWRGEPDWFCLEFYASIIRKIEPRVRKVCFALEFFPSDDTKILELKAPTMVYARPPTIKALKYAQYLVDEAVRESFPPDKRPPFPVMFVPWHIDQKVSTMVPPMGKALVMRPHTMLDTIVARPLLPGKEIPIDLLSSLVAKFKENGGINLYLYDLTEGEVEWE